MKYEEIKVGESYVTSVGYKIEVISKEDYHKAVMTIDEDGDVLGWNQYELKQFQPIKKELPERGLLVSEKGSLIFRTGKQRGYGFDIKDVFSNDADWSFALFPETWTPATPEDEAKFIKLLKQEAERLGLGADVKIKGHANNLLILPMNDGKWDAIFDLNFANNKHGRIFHNGIWAEPLTMLDEVCGVITKHLPNIVVEMTDGVVTLKQL